MDQTLQCPPFTQKVVQAMRTLYPEELADRAWDNVGLLQENIQSASGASSIVLLTNDLTIRVAEEAIAKRASVIVSYHPFIFRGLKSINLNDPHQRIVLQLAQHNIAVYSPHTAVDAAPGGLNDWLAGMLDDVTNVSAVKPIAGFTPEGFEGAGYGRLVKLARPYSVGWIAKRYADRLGSLRHVMVARPFKGVNKSNEIRTVAVCAGSGYDVLKDTAADLIVTGEMSHHNALRLTMVGKWVLTVFHSNSERQFLAEVLQPRLQRLLRETEQDAEVLVSREDTDPFVIWDVKDLPDL